MSNTTQKPRATKTYREFVAKGLNDEQAVKATLLTRDQGVEEAQALVVVGFTPAAPAKPSKAERKAAKAAKRAAKAEPKSDPRIDALVAVGFTAKQAQDILAGASTTPAQAEPVQEVTLHDKVVAKAASVGLEFTKGRVYLSDDMLAAAARVAKTGTPEVVTNNREGYRQGVAIWPHEGALAVQNLKRATA